MRSFWLRVSAVSLCAGLLAISAAARAADVKVLNAIHGMNADTPKAVAMQKFAELVQKRSEGRIRINIIETAGDDGKQTAALEAGTLDIACPDSSTLSRFVTGFSVINYPFTFLDETEADFVLDGSWGQQMLAGLRSHGLVGLGYWENGFRHLTNSKHPITDLKNPGQVRIRVMQNPMLIESFNALGFETVPMPFAKVYGALKSKEVDGQENPLPTILSSKFYEVQPYLTLSRHVYSAWVFLISRKTWDGLSAQDQQLIAQAEREAREQERKLNREASAAALEQLQAKGVKLSTIEVRQADVIRNRLNKVFEKYNHEIGYSSVLAIYAELGQFRLRRSAAAGASQPRGK